MNKTIDERLSIRLPVELKQLLRQRAKLRGLSIGAYLRHVLGKAVRLDWGFEDKNAS